MTTRLMRIGMCFGLATLLGACSGAGIYEEVGVAGPTADLETIRVDPQIELGRPPSASRGGL